MRPVSFPGNELRKRREELGLSIYESFRQTHVSADYLLALERGDLTKLPETCFALGYLKTYCQFLGLSPERYSDSFRACVRGSASRFLGREQEKGFRPPAWMHDLVTWAVVTAIVLLGWVTYTVVFQPQSDTPSVRVQAGTIELTTPPLQGEDTAP